MALQPVAVTQLFTKKNQLNAPVKPRAEILRWVLSTVRNRYVLQ